MSQQDLPFDADRAEPETTEVPAGGAGADSGASSSVEIDPDDATGVKIVSSQNDIAGVGTRGPDGPVSSTASVGAPSHGEPEQEARAADPAYARSDEDAGAAHRNARVSQRDSADPDAAQADGGYQHLPRMAQNASTHEQELAGLVVQTRADLALGIPRERVGEILRQRLRDAGIDVGDDVVDDLTDQVLAGA
jgi:hypothetical protein